MVKWYFTLGQATLAESLFDYLKTGLIFVFKLIPQTLILGHCIQGSAGGTHHAKRNRVKVGQDDICKLWRQCIY